MGTFYKLTHRNEKPVLAEFELDTLEGRSL